MFKYEEINSNNLLVKTKTLGYNNDKILWKSVSEQYRLKHALCCLCNYD